MNIVFFVESYFHKPLMNGICVKKIVDELSNKGHKVTVFTSSENVYGLPSFEVVDGVEVYRIKRDLLTTFRLYRTQKNDNVFLKLLYMFYGTFVYKFMFIFWPLMSFFTPIRYAHIAKKALKNNKPDVIVGTHLHLEEVLAAICLKKKFKDATMITYTLDALSGRKQPITGKKEAYANKIMKKWENYVFKKSDKICVMDAHRNHYENGNYDADVLKKIRYVDVPLLSINETTSPDKRDVKRVKNIVYAGSASVVTGSPRYMIDLLREIDDVELHMYGSTDPEVRQLIDTSDLLGNKLFHHGYVNHKDASKALDNADFLVTFGSQNECMVSGKIFEYMSKKKPVIAFYQIDNDINMNYLKKYPNSIILKEFGNNFAQDVEKLKSFLEKDDFCEIDDNYLRNTFYKSTPQAMVDEILNNKLEED